MKDKDKLKKDFKEYFDSNGRVIIREEDVKTSKENSEKLVVFLNNAGYLEITCVEELVSFLKNCPEDKLKNEVMPIIDIFLKS